jgi:sporulation protein YlmC with PRC-barrel domain
MAAAPAADATATDATAPAAGEAGFVSFSADQVRATTMIGKEVFGPDDQSIGEISDLVLQDDGETRAALIDVGGFLGVGEKEVAIPFEQIQVTQANAEGQTADGQTAAPGEPRLTLSMTKEEIEQLPAFEDRTMGSEQAATDAAGTDAAAPVDQDMAAGTDATAPADPNMAADTAAAPTDGAVLATRDMSAGELIGSAVYGPGDESIGEVEELLLDREGRVAFAILGRGGVLDIGESFIPVPWSNLRLNYSKEDTSVTAVIDITKERLEKAPLVKGDSYANLLDPKFREYVYKYYGSGGGAGAGATQPPATERP